MHTILGSISLDMNITPFRIDFKEYPGAQPKELGLAVSSEDRDVDNYVAFFSPTNRLIFRKATEQEGQEGGLMNRQWLVPADTEICSIAANAAAYRTEDPSILVIDLSSVDHELVAFVLDGRLKVVVVNSKTGQITQRFSTVSEYDVWLCQNPDLGLPVPAWEKSGYRYPSGAWVKPNIQEPEASSPTT